MNKCTLPDLLSGTIIIEERDQRKSYTFEGVLIPMMQRDYAQGREEEREIRKRFLDTLFRALKNRAALELDFVYGSIKEVDGRHFFVPLDGQQRLTTLFLLYWYIGGRELKGDNLEELRCTLKRFSYATRASTRAFCERLCNILPTLESTPARGIKEAAWFHRTYQRDPTVAAMLVMLDAIHQHYQAINQPLYEGLSRLSFYVLPLDGFDLSDELYIKMNARGKQLTDFENWKADLTGWMKDKENPFAEEFHCQVEETGRIIPYYLSFGLRMDNSWTNLLWNYARAGEEKLVDPYFIRFFHRYLLNCFITRSPFSQEAIEKDKVFQRFYSPAGNEETTKYESFTLYRQVLEMDGVLRNVQIILDQLTLHAAEIHELIRPVWEQGEVWTLFDAKISQRQRVLFAAVTMYLEKETYHTVRFRQWIRVVWNLISDPDLRSIPAMISVMRLVHNLSEGAGDIYSFLVGDSCVPLIGEERSFVQAQLEEERKKAVWILSDGSWESVLIKGEMHPLFQGSIRHLLQDDPGMSTLKHRIAMSCELFDHHGAKGGFALDHLLMRALISRIERFEELCRLNLSDTPDNWQLLLRRNPEEGTIIRAFCDLPDSDHLLQEVSLATGAPSCIRGWSEESTVEAKAQHIHEQLYLHADFHRWIQLSGAVNLKWSNHLFYVYRPRSRYDWVALESYRNELAAHLLTRFGLSTEHRCGGTNFFWGAKIVLTGNYKGILLTLEMDGSALRVGVKDSGRPVDQGITYGQDEAEDGWIVRKFYDFGAINLIGEVVLLGDRVGAEVFNELDSGSFLSRLKVLLEIPPEHVVQKVQA